MLSSEDLQKMKRAEHNEEDNSDSGSGSFVCSICLVEFGMFRVLLYYLVAVAMAEIT